MLVLVLDLVLVLMLMVVRVRVHVLAWLMAERYVWAAVLLRRQLLMGWADFGAAVLPPIL